MVKQQRATVNFFAPTCIAVLLAAAFQVVAKAQDTSQRDQALKRIEACLLSNDASSTVCETRRTDAQLLVERYRNGDKSVLPTLLRLKYMSTFYDEALLADPDGFLSALAGLPQNDRRSVEIALAGGGLWEGRFKPLDKKMFENIRFALTAIPDTSPHHGMAEECLKVTLANNATLLVSYFPAETFKSPAAELKIFLYSRDLYSLDERALWSLPAAAPVTYRLTLLSSSAPQTVILTVAPDGSGELRFKRMDKSRDALETNEASSITSDQVARFLEELKQAGFWEMPTEMTTTGVDGAVWMLEGAKAGTYHVAVRWCPGYEHASSSAAFAEASRLLLVFAKHELKGSC